MVNSFQILTSTETNEWYTPPPIINSARRLMGDIDIDPASNPTAQQWIQAKTYYRQHQDGLKLPWCGRLLLNPPYGKKNIKLGIHGAAAWLNRAYLEYQQGNVTEGVVIARGDSDAIKLLTQNCLFVDCDRIAFISCDGTISTKPVPGTRIFYLGNNAEGFIELFRQYGTILRAVS